MLMLTLGLLTACQSFQVHPFEVGITLPYSENCRFKNVMTKQVTEYPPVECERIKKRSLILTSEAWKVIRTDIQNNCAARQCVELTGKLDSIFLEVDDNLNQIPW